MELPGDLPKCSFGKSLVIVNIVTVYDANVRFYYGSIYSPISSTKYVSAETVIPGIYTACIHNLRYVEPHIQKDGVNFGSGKGKWHVMKGVSGAKRGVFDYNFPPVFATDLPSPEEIICTAWETAANVSVPVLLSPTRGFPIKVSNAKWSCPNLGTVADISNKTGYIKVAGKSYSFNIRNGTWSGDLKTFVNIRSLISSFPGFTKRFDIQIDIPNKNTGYTSFTKPVSLPEAQPGPIDSVCRAWRTEASPSVPGTLRAPFNISVSNAKWICEDNPSDFESINVPGEVIIGRHTFPFPINNGYGMFYLKDHISVQDLIAELGGGEQYTPPLTAPTPPQTVIPPSISPKVPGSTTVSLHLKDYMIDKKFTPIKGAYWGGGSYNGESSNIKFVNIHAADNAQGSGQVELHIRPGETEKFGEYEIKLLSTHNIGSRNAYYRVKISL